MGVLAMGTHEEYECPRKHRQDQHPGTLKSSTVISYSHQASLTRDRHNSEKSSTTYAYKMVQGIYDPNGAEGAISAGVQLI